MQPNIMKITLDIETSPRVGLFFGNTYKAQVAKSVQESYVFGFSWKLYHKKVQSCYIWDFARYKKDPTNDIEVVKKYIEVATAAGIIIGQNSRSFDDKVMMGRIIIHDLDPPTPFQTIDTKSELQGVARYDQNGLDYVSKLYGHGGKHETGGIDLWWECMDIPGFKKGNPLMQRKMVRYCENDVVKTEKKYDREFRFYKRHPNMNLITGQTDACPKCGVAAGFTLHGSYFTSTSEFKVWRCSNCGSHPRSRVSEKVEKSRLV